MPTLSSIQRRLRPPHGWPVLLGALVLLAIAIVIVRIPFRAELRDQIAHRDARILATLIQQQLDETGSRLFREDPLAATLAASFNPGLPGVLAIQIYSPEGQLFASLLGPTNAVPPPEPLQPATQLPVTRFIPGAPPQLQVWLPLQPATATGVLGYTHITLDASDLAAEYDRLDAGITRQSLLTFLGIGFTLTLILALAFHRLQRANLLLADRSNRLEQANRDLSLAARTSAVGAVASHLVHGLRNPLLALQQAVAEAGHHPDASDTARRMRAMIDDVVRVLRDEQGLPGFEISADELLAETGRRGRSQLPAHPVIQWESIAGSGPPLDNRTANLTLLILENLVTNAAQALSSEGIIRLHAAHTAGHWEFEVHDNGPGLPPEIQARLFTPSLSGRPGGSGLGLALSRQLALHLGGSLQLRESIPGHTCFHLSLPS